jgi:hypothetical protein
MRSMLVGRCWLPTQATTSSGTSAAHALAGVGVPEPVMFYEGLLGDLLCDAEGRPVPRLIREIGELTLCFGVEIRLSWQRGLNVAR